MIPDGINGINHINIYSKGETALGRWMTNFHHQPFTCEDGRFNCMEGYWYWLGTGNERFRTTNGWDNKKLGRQAQRLTHRTEEEFQGKIERALRHKINGNPQMKDALRRSVLPFAHYYDYSGTRKDAGFEWITALWEKFRLELKSIYG